MLFGTVPIGYIDVTEEMCGDNFGILMTDFIYLNLEIINKFVISALKNPLRLWLSQKFQTAYNAYKRVQLVRGVRTRFFLYARVPNLPISARIYPSLQSPDTFLKSGWPWNRTKYCQKISEWTKTKKNGILDRPKSGPARQVGPNSDRKKWNSDGSMDFWYGTHSSMFSKNKKTQNNHDIDQPFVG